MPWDLDGILSGSGDSYDDETLATKLRAWENDVVDALIRRHPDIEDSLKFSTKLPLDKLPVRVRAQFMQRYRSIVGLDYVLNSMGNSGVVDTSNLKYLESKKVYGATASKITKIWDQLQPMRKMDSDNAYARFPTTVDDRSLINRLYTNMNLQFRPNVSQDMSGILDPKNTPASAANYFTLGRSSISRVDSMNEVTRSVPSFVGKKVTVFDIETAGLVNNQIREIAYNTFMGDSAGNLASSVSGQIAFRPHQFSRGLMYHMDQNMDLEQYMHSKHGLDVSGLRASNGEDFIKSVTPFLKTIEESDYLVGHNIAHFDIEQIFTGLGGTKRYKNDQKFAAYVDSMYKKSRAATVDTLDLVRNAKNLEGLTIAKELGEEGKLYSISNLLLKTNLTTLIGPERLAEAMGYNEATGVFAKGLHHGDVDTLVTSALLNHVDELQVKTGMASGFSGKKLSLLKDIKKQIVQSSALTPTTRITERANILPVLRDAYDRGVAITPLDQLIHSQRDLQYGVKPNLSTADLNPQAMSTRVRMFDRYKDLGVQGLREKLAANFIPFAGLSMEERAFGTALSRATAGNVTVGKAAAELAADSQITRFELFNPSTVQYGTYSGRATVPSQILQDAGLLSFNADDPTMLRMSAVDTTAYNDKRAINLVYQFKNEQEIEQLTAKMQHLADTPEAFAEIMGIAEDSDGALFAKFQHAVRDTDLIQNLIDNGMKKGVSIAQVYTDPEQVNEIFGLLSDFTIRDASKLRDEDTFKLALPFMDIEGGTVRTAGVILDKALTDEDKLSIGQSVIQSKRVDEGYMNMMGNREARVFASVLDKNYTREAIETTQKLMTSYVTNIRPNIGKLTVGAIGASAALLLFHKKREQDRYDVAIQKMPATNTRRYAIADQLQARIDAGYDGYRQQIDPLATASIVSNLNDERLGHTNMGWDRNTNLYGGVL